MYQETAPHRPGVRRVEKFARSSIQRVRVRIFGFLRTSLGRCFQARWFHGHICLHHSTDFLRIVVVLQHRGERSPHRSKRGLLCRSGVHHDRIDSDVWTNPIFAIRQCFQIQFFHDILARGECKRNPTKGEIPAEESITIDLHIRTNTESSQILPHYEYLD